MTKDSTTINIKKTIRRELQKARKYPRETYNETLKRLIRERKIK